MQRKKMSGDQSQPRTQSVRRGLERYKSMSRVEIIDVDDEKTDAVKFNAAETSHKGSRGSKTMRVDDDDEDDDVVISVESIDEEDSDIDDEDSDTHRNKPFKSEESQNDECASKRKRPPSDLREHMCKDRDCGPSNWFGFSFSSESSSSDNDSTDSESIISDGNDSDCEIIEDSLGDIRKQWEKAAFKKKMSYRAEFGSEEQFNASRTSTDEQVTCRKAEIENCINKGGSNHAKQLPAESSSDNPSSGKNLPHMVADTEFGSSSRKKDTNTTDLDTYPTSNVIHKKSELTSETFSHKDQSITNSLLANAKSGFQEAHTDLIFKRERHKESDEYRGAVIEAARKCQLEIQAEEAQRLKKRRKAEKLRLIDMEKRQKRRLEEIRESQKKDEETIHIKEHLRAEVRKDLEKVELRCKDMASLLRGLGVHVEGGLYPMPCEVNAAYKQALLRFHPDRASRSDIHQQVKAEETFKMISRMKEKLLPVS